MLNTGSRTTRHNGGETTHQGGEALGREVLGGGAPGRGALGGVTPRGKVPRGGGGISNDSNQCIASL